ncbi:MAG: hypothetical protein AABM67_10360 [Acidobacteriota bacterium]
MLAVRAVSVAQETAPPPAAPSSCSRDSALEIIQQQIDATRTFDNTVQRITVLIRAADLLWTYRQKPARAALTEAFDLAVQHFKEKGEETTGEGRMLIKGPDQRYRVLSAIAKHDSVWAKKLTEQLLKEEQREAEAKAPKDDGGDVRRAEQLLTTAGSLLNSDEATALNFARRSLRYPATFFLPGFLYSLADRNRAAADQLYGEALAAYASAPMERLLYLSSYPFGNDREAGEMPGYTTYQVPAGFVPNLNLQRSFVQTVLRRVRELGNTPREPAADDRLSDSEQMWLALTRLERQIQQSLPDLTPEVEAARGNLYAQLSQASQRQMDQIANPEKSPQRTFDEQVEAALKNPNVDVRDQQITNAIIGASREEILDHVLSAVDKISDSGIRQPLLNWIYFDRAQRAIKDQKLDEARKLALRVEELDQRAWLYSRIADESLKHGVDQTQAREVLDEVVDATAKAPNTPVAARALLHVAYLYTKIDMNRAIAVMAEAVKRINRIEQPDFSRQFVIRKIEGKTFSSYAGFVTPGFTPESTFREIGKIDFDGMLNLASNFSDKHLRATSTLALVEVCLQQSQKSEKSLEKTRPKPNKP